MSRCLIQTWQKKNLAIRILKQRKACGHDMIRNEMINLSSPVLIDCICALFNTMIKSGRVPTGWAHSYIIPIFKGGSDTDTTNYRGISIISCLAKLCSAILNTRLIKHIYRLLNEYSVLGPSSWVGIWSPSLRGDQSDQRTRSQNTALVGGGVYQDLNSKLWPPKKSEI